MNYNIKVYKNDVLVLNENRTLTRDEFIDQCIYFRVRIDKNSLIDKWNELGKRTNLSNLTYFYTLIA